MAGLQAQKGPADPRDLRRQNPPALKPEICLIWMLLLPQKHAKR